MSREYGGCAATDGGRLGEIDREVLDGEIALSSLVYDFGAFFLVNVRADDSRSATCELHHGRLANARSTTGNQGNLVVESHRAAPFFVCIEDPVEPARNASTRWRVSALLGSSRASSNSSVYPPRSL